MQNVGPVINREQPVVIFSKMTSGLSAHPQASNGGVNRRARLDLERALSTAMRAAHSAGDLIRRQLASHKRATAMTQHDIKLELDLRCQRLIERVLRSAFPEVGSLGEEGVAGDPNTEHRWVVDPIDGTVNFAYRIPHSCVSIALQSRSIAGAIKSRRPAPYPGGYQTLVGVIYDPFRDELWTAIAGRTARLNGKVIRVSRRRKLEESIIAIGLSKSREHLEATLPFLNKLALRVRKLRIMGAGALDLAYVAAGRFDAYIERYIRLWDIAAGGLILECAGGEVWREPIPGDYAFRMIASNKRLKQQLAGIEELHPFQMHD
jgi:myo-inositol-1(or 4)-monophosphatase